MSKHGLQQSDIIKNALAAQAPDLKVMVETRPVVTIHTSNPRYEAALRDYLAEPYVEAPIVPNSINFPLKKGVRFVETGETHSPEMAASEEEGLRDYLSYHLLGQRLGEFFIRHPQQGYAVQSNIALKPAYLLGKNEGNGGYYLATDHAGPHTGQMMPLLSAMLAEQGMHSKSAVRRYYENARGEAKPYLPSSGDMFLGISAAARAPLNALDDAQFFALAEQVWPNVARGQNHTR